MTTSAEIQTKVNKTITNMDRFDSIVNGSETTTVTTDAGPVPSVQKLLYDTGPVLQAKHVRFTLAKLNLVSSPSANDIGMVIGDASNVNGTYEYSGSAWVRKGDLPVDRSVHETLVAQAAADEALGHKNEALATESRINSSTAMITNYRGAWITGIAYADRDLVLQSGLVYICTVAHTSGTFATDLAAPKWAIYQGATTTDLADKANDGLGAGMVGYRGTTVGGQVALDHRKPRRLFAKLYASYSAATHLKWMSIGDSLAGFKANHLIGPIERLFGGINASGVNTTGDNFIQSSVAGGDLNLGTSSGLTTLSSRWDLWPTGNMWEFAAGGYATFVRAGVNPTFTKVRVYYIKESGAGTIGLSVGGTQVASASAANATVDVGYLEYTQSAAQAAVRIDVTGAAVHVIDVHYARDDISGVETYQTFSKGGLLLQNAMSSAQGRAIFQAWLALVGIDFFTFEMDDDFGDGAEDDAAWNYLAGILSTAAPRADKLIFGSTPRASGDSGKLAASAFLRGYCAGHDASWLFFDTYYIVGSYADMVAIFGSDDGVHPNNAVSAFTAAQVLQFLGLPIAEMGYLPMPVMSPSQACWFGTGTKIGPTTTAGIAHKMTVDSNGFVGQYVTDYAWGVAKNDGTCKFQVSYAGSWPTVMPLSHDFDSAANVRKRDTQTVSGLEFTRWRKTDNAGGGKMHMDVGMVRLSSFTRAELLALSANAMVGTICWCSDATNGAGIVVARGQGTTDWRRVADDSAI